MDLRVQGDSVDPDSEVFYFFMFRYAHHFFYWAGAVGLRLGQGYLKVDGCDLLADKTIGSFG